MILTFQCLIKLSLATAQPVEITAESIGTEFVLIFPSNSGGQPSAVPNVSVDLVNPTDTDVTVEILKGYTADPIQRYLHVPSQSVIKVSTSKRTMHVF